MALLWNMKAAAHYPSSGARVTTSNQAAACTQHNNNHPEFCRECRGPPNIGHMLQVKEHEFRALSTSLQPNFLAQRDQQF